MRRRNFIVGTLTAALLGTTAIVPPAQANVAFTSFAFNATGGTTPRTMPNRLADIINVLDYGADPTFTNDSAPAFQLAFDAAFGSSASPHGLANSFSNRAVFIPNGKYKINSTLNLTRVVGGNVYGAGPGATILSGPTGSTCFAINGAAGLSISRLELIGGSATTGIAIDLDWDNTSGGDGLHDNTFSDLLIAQWGTGVRIANAGNDGAGNLFQACTFSQMVTGIDAKSASAVNNLVLGGGGNTITGQLYWSSLGQLNVSSVSVGNNASGTIYAVRVDSGFPVSIIGGRGEASDALHGNFLKLTYGNVLIRGFSFAGGVEFVNISGGKITIDATVIGNSGGGQINGAVASATGTISGTSLVLSGISGTPAIGQVVSGAGIATGTLAPWIISGSGTTWVLNRAPGNVGPISVTLGSVLYLRGCSGFNISGYNGTVAQDF